MSELAVSLFWVACELKERNWFVLADSLKCAAEFHANETGSKVLRRNGYVVGKIRSYRRLLTSTVLTTTMACY
jgi:hypothetical protein